MQSSEAIQQRINANRIAFGTLDRLHKILYDELMTKKNKQNSRLSSEMFARLCELIQLGSDAELERLWSEFSADEEIDPFASDSLIAAEDSLFAEVEYLLSKVAEAMGYEKPLYPEDLEQGKPSVASPMAKKPTSPVPFSLEDIEEPETPLLVAKAE